MSEVRPLLQSIKNILLSNNDLLPPVSLLPPDGASYAVVTNSDATAAATTVVPGIANKSIRVFFIFFGANANDVTPAALQARAELVTHFALYLQPSTSGSIFMPFNYPWVLPVGEGLVFNRTAAFSSTRATFGYDYLDVEP